MQAFKYLKSNHADSFLSGNLYFGNLKYYRLLEIATGDSSVGDRFEGASLTLLNGDTADALTGANFRQQLAHHGIAGSDTRNARFVFSDFEVVQQIDGFVLCTSLSGPSAAQTIDTSYNGCITISDIDAFASEIALSGVEASTGRRLADVGMVVAKPVVYDWRSHDGTLEPSPSPDPFRKRPSYGAQQEHRILFVPHEKIKQDHIVIRCPQVAPLLSFSEIAVDLSVPSAIDYQLEIRNITNEYRRDLKEFESNYSEFFPTEEQKAEKTRFEKIIFEKYYYRLGRAILERRKHEPDEGLDNRLISQAPVPILINYIESLWVERQLKATATNASSEQSENP